jgi:hypothetical protein
MESKIGQANTRIFIFGWYENMFVGISFCKKFKAKLVKTKDIYVPFPMIFCCQN